MKYFITCFFAASMLLPVSSSSQGINVPQALTVGSDGIVYVAAQSLRAGGDSEIYIIAVDGSGSMQGSGIFGNGQTHAAGILAGPGDIRIGATEILPGGGHEMQVIAFDRSSLVWVEHPPAPSDLSMSPIWPNPVFDSRTASLELNVRNSCHVRIDLLEVNGRITARMMDNELTPGLYTVRFDAPALPAGVYFCMLFADNVRLMQKLIVLR